MDIMERFAKKWIRIGYRGGDGVGSGSWLDNCAGYGANRCYINDEEHGDETEKGWNAHWNAHWIGYGAGEGRGGGSYSKVGDCLGFLCGITFCGEKVYNIDGRNTIISKVKDNIAKGFILCDDFTTVPCYIVKLLTDEEVYFAHGRTLKEAYSSLEEKIYRKLGAEERIQEFWKTFNLTDKFPNRQFFDWHNKLTGSCLLGRETFVKNHEIDLDGESTVEEFIAMTKDDYGGEVIGTLMEYCKKKEGTKNDILG